MIFRAIRHKVEDSMKNLNHLRQPKIKADNLAQDPKKMKTGKGYVSSAVGQHMLIIKTWNAFPLIIKLVETGHRMHSHNTM